MRTVSLWTLDSNGKLIAFGHNEPKARAGDILSDPATGEVWRLVQGRHNLLAMYPIAPDTTGRKN